MATRGVLPIRPDFASPALQVLGPARERLPAVRGPNLLVSEDAAGVVFARGSRPTRTIPVITMKRPHTDCVAGNHRPGVVRVYGPQIEDGFFARGIPNDLIPVFRARRGSRPCGTLNRY